MLVIEIDLGEETKSAPFWNCYILSYLRDIYIEYSRVYKDKSYHMV